jgi:hypothetical protein
MLPLLLALGAVWGAAVLTASSRLTSPGAVWSMPLRYADGAPPGFSGGFGEQSCHACHFSAEPNTAPGSVAIAGAPQAYTPRETYALTVTLARPGLLAGGFQLTARFKEGGAQAGSFALASEESDRVKIELRADVQYVGQRRTAAAPVAPDTARWAMNWTAPSGGGAVLFHVAANAADNDETASGDFVYTALHEVAPRPPPAGSR